MWLADAIGRWLRTGVNDAWMWVASLNEQEWLLLLALTAASGLVCMRGFGSRTNY